MPWLKVGDLAADHPIALAVLENDDADERIVNELFGFAARCATLAAAHETDYIVPMGTARQIAGISRANALIDMAVRAGYFTRVEHEGKPALKLHEDPEGNLFNMILKSERAWKKQRDSDRRNPEVLVPVRQRDGDACRWCGKVVNWLNRKGNTGATYDHLRPGQAATVDTYVVACKACNSARKEGLHWKERLMDPPQQPYYGPQTVAFLANHGIAVPDTTNRPQVTPAPDLEQPAPESAQICAETRVADLDMPGRDGTGRAGTDQDRAGRDGRPDRPPQKPDTPDHHDHPPKKRGSRSRRRGRRGKR